jgi:2-phosphosulfolactate phosphatase
MPSLHVLLKKEDLSTAQLADRVVIVLDILFATSTIVHAFGKGVSEVWPALDSDEANVVAAGLGDCVRSGEYLADRLPGFAPAMPLLLGREQLRGKALVYCTTNGTVALRGAAGAAFAYVGALLNGAALVAHVRRAHPDLPVLIVCSGSVGNFNLEDFYGAGHFVELLQSHATYDLNDAARAARLLRLGCDPRTALLNSRIGLMMQARGMTDEVEYCARLDILDVVARLDGGRLQMI